MPASRTPEHGHGPRAPHGAAPGMREVDLGMAHSADVLVCDRDDVSSLLTAEVLRGAGHRVEVRDLARAVADPTAAPLLLLGDPTDAGPADGAITAIRRQHQGTHPTIVVVTASVDPDVAADLLNAGADHVLSRPWSPHLLRAVVTAHLRRHHLTCGATPGEDAVPWRS